MKHLKKGRKLGREKDIRAALLKSMASSFFLYEKIKTTEAKAKELRAYTEKAVTVAKKRPSLAARRHLVRFFSRPVTERIISYAASQNLRAGGYTRITKLPQRKSDGARMALLELTK